MSQAKDMSDNTPNIFANRQQKVKEEMEEEWVVMATNVWRITSLACGVRHNDDLLNRTFCCNAMQDSSYGEPF